MKSKKHAHAKQTQRMKDGKKERKEKNDEWSKMKKRERYAKEMMSMWRFLNLVNQ